MRLLLADDGVRGMGHGAVDGVDEGILRLWRRGLELCAQRFLSAAQLVHKRTADEITQLADRLLDVLGGSVDSVDLFFHSRHAAAQHITIESNVVGQRRDGLLLLCQERILALALRLRLGEGFLETDDLLLQTAHIGAAFGIRLDEPLHAEDPPCVIGQRRTLEIALGKLGLDELQEERGQLRRRRCRIEAVDLRPDGRRFRETRQGCARRLCIASERWLRKHDERRDAGSVTRVVAISCGSALEKPAPARHLR